MNTRSRKAKNRAHLPRSAMPRYGKVSAAYAMQTVVDSFKIAAGRHQGNWHQEDRIKQLAYDLCQEILSAAGADGGCCCPLCNM